MAGEAALVAVSIVGLLHGIEPGHGWVLALFYSIRRPTPMLRAFVSSTIISMAHFASSIIAVVAFLILTFFVTVPAQYFRYAGAALLVFLAYRFWQIGPEKTKQHGHLHEVIDELKHSHEHEHPDAGVHTHMHEHAQLKTVGLGGLASLAFILGFAHEEEFALLAFAAGGVDPFLLMVVYALSVTVALIGITLVSVRLFRILSGKLRSLEVYTPKLTAVILVVMAVIFVSQDYLTF